LGGKDGMVQVVIVVEEVVEKMQKKFTIFVKKSYFFD